jgi:histidyl-tRNA synthetase
VILGEREVQGGQATVRDLESSEQVTVPLAELSAWIAGRAGRAAGR